MWPTGNNMSDGCLAKPLYATRYGNGGFSIDSEGYEWTARN